MPAEAALKPAPGRWSTYLLGVLHGIRARGKSVGGFRLAFASNELAQGRAALQEAAVEIEELRDYIDRHVVK